MDILVKYDCGTRFTATCEGYTVSTGKGDGADKSRDGMYPAQLFAASIGMCIGGYVLGYCKHHDIPHQGMRIEIECETVRAPSRTTELRVRIRLEADVSEKDAHAILKVADRCHITNSIRGNMEVSCSLDASGEDDQTA